MDCMQLYPYPVKLFVLLIEIDKSTQAFIFLCWVFVINLLGYLCMPSIAGMNTLCCLQSDYLEVVKACRSEYYIATESCFRLFTSALSVWCQNYCRTEYTVCCTQSVWKLEWIPLERLNFTLRTMMACSISFVLERTVRAVLLFTLVTLHYVGM